MDPSRERVSLGLSRWWPNDNECTFAYIEGKDQDTLHTSHRFAPLEQLLATAERAMTQRPEGNDGQGIDPKCKASDSEEECRHPENHLHVLFPVELHAGR